MENELLNDYTDYRTQTEEADQTKRLEEEYGNNPAFHNQDASPNRDSGDLGGFNQQDLEVNNNNEPTGLRDISLGLLQAPRHIVKGFRDGVSEVLDIGDDIDKALNLPTIQLTDKEGNLSLDLLSQKTAKEKGLRPMQLPDVNIPVETQTGQVIESVAQFFTGLKGVDKVLKGMKAAKAVSAGGKIAANVGKAATADVLSFDEAEQRLSNVVNDLSSSYPELQNPITQYLAAQPSDTLVEGKLKQAIEGVGLNYVAEGVVRGVTALKKMKSLKTAAEKGEVQIFNPPIEERAGVGVEAKDFEFLGNPEDANLVIKRPAEKLADAVDDTAGMTPEQIKKAASKKATPADSIQINFARINTPEDVKNAMQAFANEPSLAKSIQESRRGVRSNAETLKAAEDIDGFQTLINRRVGQPLNAEEITASRQFYHATTEKLMQAAEKAAGPTATEIDQFNFRKMVVVHQAVQKEVLGARAEIGRALQSWAIPLEGSMKSESYRQMEAILNEHGGVEASKNLAQKIAEFKGNLTNDQINTIVQKSAGARTADALSEAWTLGLLTSPTTHAVNFGSNLINSLTLGAERYTMAAVKDSPVTYKEANYYFLGMLESQKEAFANAAKAFRTGETGFGVGKVELPRARATSKEVLDIAGPFGWGMDLYGRMVNVAGKSLAAGDEYAKTVLYKAQLKALATRDGISKGLTGDELKKHIYNASENPSEFMRADALDFAKYGTYTKELGKTGKAIQSVISRNPAMRFIVPFVRTPVNIFKASFERTPLAYASRSVREDIKAGGVRKAQAVARMGLGTSVMMTATDMALNGQITGGGPADPAARKTLQRMGWQPYSIKVDGKYYSYSRVEPIGTLIGMAADMSEILSNYDAYDIRKQQEIDDIVTASVIAVSNQVVGKTFLQGFSDTAELFSDPRRYGQQYLQRYAGSLIPAGVATTERAIDPELSYVTSTLDAIKARTPGLSKDVPTQYNVYGEPRFAFVPEAEGYISTAGERVSSLVNPIYSSKVKDSPIDRFLLQNGINIEMPQTMQRFEGIDIDLKDNPEIYSRLVRLRGQEITLPRYGGLNMKEALDALVDRGINKSGRFYNPRTTIEDQDMIIKGVVRDYQEEAKKVLREEYPIIDQLIYEGKGTIPGNTELDVNYKQLP